MLGHSCFRETLTNFSQVRSPEKRYRRRTQHSSCQSAADVIEAEPHENTDGVLPSRLDVLSEAAAVVEPFPQQSPLQYLADIALLQRENESLRTLVSEQEEQLKHHSSFTFAQIQSDNSKVSFFTGLPDKETFRVLLDFLARFPLHYHCEWRVGTLPLCEQLLLTLMRLRLNVKVMHLATQFNVSASTVCNVFVTIVSALHDILYKEIMEKNVPSVTQNRACLPRCFAQFPNCRMVIDCTEIRIDQADSLKLRCATYSNYKSHTTFKSLIGIAPNGVVTYVSDLYGGSKSDKEIVQDCGILSWVTPGDMLMADKDFNIRNVLPSGVELNIPSFLYHGQFTKEEVVNNKKLSAARIHVERAIQRVKMFTILDHIPASLYKHADKIFKVCACLTNFQTPIMAEVGANFSSLA